MESDLWCHHLERPGAVCRRPETDLLTERVALSTQQRRLTSLHRGGVQLFDEVVAQLRGDLVGGEVLLDLCHAARARDDR
jgi:hypothetical protein